MSQFFNQMVITCDRDDKMQFAGIEQKFKRPMMIHSAGAVGRRSFPEKK